MQIKKFDEWASAFPDKCFEREVDLCLVLGSGWGEALEMDEALSRLAYSEIPGFGEATVQGHAGEFILYRRGKKLIAAWCGRRHFYEGVEWEKVVFPVEMARRMGAKAILLTNAAGGINPALKAGDFVIIRDHLNLMFKNPLIGPHNPEWGARFPDMSEVYARHLSEKLRAGVNRLGLRALDGVYAALTGPAYETPAEIKALKILGADVVGMSTVPEAVFAHAIGLEVAALSLVSNLAAGISVSPLSHREVIEASEQAKTKMRLLIEDFIDRL